MGSCAELDGMNDSANPSGSQLYSALSSERLVDQVHGDPLETNDGPHFVVGKVLRPQSQSERPGLCKVVVNGGIS